MNALEAGQECEVQTPQLSSVSPETGICVNLGQSIFCSTIFCSGRETDIITCPEPHSPQMYGGSDGSRIRVELSSQASSQLYGHRPLPPNLPKKSFPKVGEG